MFRFKMIVDAVSSDGKIFTEMFHHLQSSLRIYDLKICDKGAKIYIYFSGIFRVLLHQTHEVFSALIVVSAAFFGAYRGNIIFIFLKCDSNRLCISDASLIPVSN